MPLAIATITTNTTASAANAAYFIDATSNNVTLTLPALLGDGSTDGIEFQLRRIDNVGGNTVTVAAGANNDIVIVGSLSSFTLPAVDAGLGAIILCSRLTTWWMMG